MLGKEDLKYNVRALELISYLPGIFPFNFDKETRKFWVAPESSRTKLTAKLVRLMQVSCLAFAFSRVIYCTLIRPEWRPIETPIAIAIVCLGCTLLIGAFILTDLKSEIFIKVINHLFELPHPPTGKSSF